MQKSKNVSFQKFFLRPILFGLCFLFLTACNEKTLYSDLSQTDANKVMVLLEKNGLPATLVSERKQNETVWVITVKEEHMPRARELIVGSEVISPKAPDLSEVYQQGSGWGIKSPSEERARSQLALKGEIINSLKKLPEVIDADVVINIPEPLRLGSKEKQRPTASVVIKAKKPEVGEPALSELTLQQWIANTVDGLASRDVAVMIHYMIPVGKPLHPGESTLLPNVGTSKIVPDFGELAESNREEELMGLKLSEQSKQRLKLYLVIFFGVLVVLSLALIIVIIQNSRARQEIKQLQSGEPLRAIEGRVMEEESEVFEEEGEE